MQQIAAVLILFGSALLTAQQQHLVVPAQYQTTDANSLLWIAGASQDVRQQTLIGASHLQPLIGRSITAIELRRNAENEAYIGGAVNLAVTLSTSPTTPLSAAAAFANNVGPDAVQVFAGSLTIPSSPAVPNGTIGWLPTDTVRCAFTQPFVYNGGTLCVDVRGTTVPGQEIDWWMADCVFEDIQGTAVEVGTGCGTFGGVSNRWSFVDTRTLLAGAHAMFWAYGNASDMAMLFLGGRAPVPLPLSLFGLPTAANCLAHVSPTGLVGSLMTAFVPPDDPRLSFRGGCAVVTLPLPNAPWVLGLSMTAQWMDVQQQFAVSNAIEWTVAPTLPSLDMAHIEGEASGTIGHVSVHQAHVFRFEYQ